MMDSCLYGSSTKSGAGMFEHCWLFKRRITNRHGIFILRPHGGGPMIEHPKQCFPRTLDLKGGTVRCANSYRDLPEQIFHVVAHGVRRIISRRGRILALTTIEPALEIAAQSLQYRFSACYGDGRSGYVTGERIRQHYVSSCKFSRLSRSFHRYLLAEVLNRILWHC